MKISRDNNLVWLDPFYSYFFRAQIRRITKQQENKK